MYTIIGELASRSCRRSHAGAKPHLHVDSTVSDQKEKAKEMFTNTRSEARRPVRPWGLGWLIACALALVLAAAVPAAPPTSGTMEIYLVDVEGGAATLIVSPTGESIISDGGFPRGDARDAKRIHHVAKLAGLTKIDYAVVSHYHRDHFGSLPELAKLIPIGKFVDHGDSVEQRTDIGFLLFQYHLKAAEGRRWIAKPGETIPLGGATVTIVSSHTKLIDRPLRPDQVANPWCTDATLKSEGHLNSKRLDMGENGHSLGFVLKLGAFDFINLGDLTWNYEHSLSCPRNLIGEIDLYQSTHHGSEASGPPQHIWGMKPKVAIFNNGTHHGGDPSVYKIVRKSPGLEDIWAMHKTLHEYNTDEKMIANLTEEVDQRDPHRPAKCEGHWIRVSVAADGSKYTISNSRNGFSKSYTAR